MDGERFDHVTRLLASRRSRRGFAGLLSAGALAVMPLRALAAAGKRGDGSVCSKNADCESAFCAPRNAQGRRLCTTNVCGAVQGNDGDMFCVKRGAGFCKIDHGVGIYFDCAPGTVCAQVDVGLILCDFPG